jgi:hypothetical protein
VTLPLEKDGAKLPNTPPMAVPPPGVPPAAATYAPPGVNPGGLSGGASVTTIGGASAGLKSIPTRTLRLPNGPGGAAPFPGATVQNVQPQSSGADLTPEEQMILIEAQREHAKGKGDPVSAIFPPTPLSAPTPHAPAPVPR